MSRTVCVIPARWSSTRFPGKPLAPIRGATGVSKPLIVRTLKQAVKAQCFDAIYVATDDERIEQALHGWCEVIMTGESCRNGTERCAEAATKLDLRSSDIVVNLQGDSVLTPPAWLSMVASYMRDSPPLAVATTIYHRGPFESPNPGDTEAFVDDNFHALYFTRGPMPQDPRGRYQHFGIYGYRVAALWSYERMQPGRREEAESLEQLRFLEHGIPIQCLVPTVPGGVVPEREVNYPDDVLAVEEVLKQWNIV
jgi:3-deoxy-manno-octulosonate cytidylyltransferase (CMP-KDO synthetase)